MWTSGLKLKLTFIPIWNFTYDIIPRKIFDDIKLDLSSRSSPPPYETRYEIYSKDLDLSKFYTCNVNISTANIADKIATNIATLSKRSRSYKKWSLGLDVVTLIHESLKELKDSKALLDLCIRSTPPKGTICELTWYFMMIPDSLVLYCNPLFSSLTPSRFELSDVFCRVGIPTFELELCMF